MSELKSRRDPSGRPPGRALRGHSHTNAPPGRSVASTLAERLDDAGVGLLALFLWGLAALAVLMVVGNVYYWIKLN